MGISFGIKLCDNFVTICDTFGLLKWSGCDVRFKILFQVQLIAQTEPD